MISEAVLCHLWCIEANSVWPPWRQVLDLLSARRKAVSQGIRRGVRRLQHGAVRETPLPSKIPLQNRYEALGTADEAHNEKRKRRNLRKQSC